MKVFLAIIAAAGLGYFLGSLNFSIIVVRMMTGRDIRDMGSKNAGLTNTLRCAGKSCALFTLLGDLLKGIIAVALARGLCHLLHAGLMPGNDTHYIGYIAGFFAILGHVFPIYYSFKGGKGVLVGAASFLAVDYKVFLSTAYCPLATLLMSWLIDGYSFGRSFLYLIMSLPMAAMVIWMHRSNIQRLLDGNENKFSFKTININ